MAPSATSPTARLAPRWIQDLVQGQLPEVENLIGRGAEKRLQSLSQNGRPHLHTLSILDTQSATGTVNPAIFSLFCRECHYHFHLTVKWDTTKSHQLCNGGNNYYCGSDEFPPQTHLAHHVCPVTSDFRKELDQLPTNPYTQFYPLVGTLKFGCSKPRCPLEMSLEVSEPRLKLEWLNFITDEERIRHALEAARQSDPDRYKDSSDSWCSSGMSLLNTYLLNRLKNDERRISKRNKRFRVVLGDSLRDLFLAMGYMETKGDNGGVEEEFYFPLDLPSAAPAGALPEHRDQRAFVEGMQAEVESHLIRVSGSGSNQFDNSIVSSLEKVLHCANWPRTHRPLHNVHLAEPDFSLLGILPNFGKTLVLYAYQCQVTYWPSCQRTLPETLQKVAQALDDDELLTQAIMEASILDEAARTSRTTETEIGPTQPGFKQPAESDLVSGAMHFFNEASSVSTNCHDYEIVYAYRLKMRETSEQNAAKMHMEILARARNSDRLKEALDEEMTLPTARNFLEPPNTDPESADDSLYEFLVNDKMSESSALSPALVLEVATAALTIARYRRFKALEEFALQLVERHGVRNLLVQTDKLQERAVATEIPAGLQNIGNTCYLNSILQYLNTVSSVRTVTEHFGEYELGLSDDAIDGRRLGKNQLKVDRAEALVAHVVVRELQQLFGNMNHSREPFIRPSQRLANAVLMSTSSITENSKRHGTQSDQKHTSESTGNNTSPPPPLPARPQSAGGVEHVEDANMPSISVEAVSDSASNGSSKTLVDDIMEIDSPAKSLDSSRVEQVPSQPGDNAVTTVVELKDKPDVQMGGTSEPSTQPGNGIDDKRILASLETQTRSSGTDQQDVEEVMGAIINRLQAAIRPDDETKDGVQMEEMMRTFYVDIRQYTGSENSGEFRTESALDRSITAYPAATGPCSIYQALGRNFDFEVLEGSQTLRYSAIAKLPPVLHVLIQRTKQTGDKNENPVEVDEVLYLDRFMDHPRDSQPFKLRNAAWWLQKRLDHLACLPLRANEGDQELLTSFLQSELRTQKDRDEVHRQASDEARQFQGQGDMRVEKPETSELVDGLVEGHGEAESEQTEDETKKDSDDKFCLLNDQPTSKLDFATKTFEFGHVEPSLTEVDDLIPSTSLDDVPSLELIDNLAREKIEKYSEAIDGLFSSYTKEKYWLHAVICHSGRLNAGHYWIWIRDFKEGVWRNYNDERVESESDTSVVLKKLNDAGAPYFLCYVRDEDKETAVSVPKRGSGSEQSGGSVEVANDQEAPAPPSAHPNSPAEAPENPPSYEKSTI